MPEPLTPEQQEAAATFILFFILVSLLVLAGVGRLVFWLAERRAERAEPANDRAPVRNPIEPRSVGSVNVPEPPRTAVVDAPTLLLIQRIAAHKVQHAADGKEATAFAVCQAKKGSSKAYREFSAAWDLLYPVAAPAEPAADRPEAWEPGERAGQLRRRLRAMGTGVSRARVV
jgi:hypothetical protein